MNYQPSSFPIASEAWPFVVPVVFAMVLSFFFGWTWWAVALLLVAGYIVYFFRNPERSGPYRGDAVVAPADGKIVSAGIVSHPDFENGQALRIAIFMSLVDVHVNWSPVSGEVTSAEHYPGKFLNAMNDKCGDENERKILKMTTPDGVNVIVKLVAGLVARRIVCPVDKGDTLRRGEKVGLIRFGSRVETFLPAGSSLQVGNGMMVRGGETVIALLEPPAVLSSSAGESDDAAEMTAG